MNFTSVNPATGKPLATFPAHTTADVQQILLHAHTAQEAWARTSLSDRLAVLARLTGVLTARVDEAAAMITGEMGKPLTQARAEVLKCATVVAFALEQAPALVADRDISTEYAVSRIQFRPMGIVLSVMPWNFPFWQFFRFAVPALAMGNAVLLKHAPTTWGCAELAVEFCREAGLPEGLVHTVRVDVPDVESIIADHRVRAVTFTGSTQGGRAVGALAGKYVKKAVLELGGSDAYVVLEDADLDRAASMCVQQRCVNTGQSCIAAKRFVVHTSVADAFRDRVVQQLAALRVGDPLDPSTDLGPLARADLKQGLIDQVARAVEQGAQLWVQGALGGVTDVDIDGPGFFVRPALLTNVRPGTVADQEELFGPVAALITVDSDDEAVAVANGNSFGLGAAVFSQDRERAHGIAARLQAGTMTINDVVRSDARLPFGGVKDSGYGRELGTQGMLEFVNVTTVVEP